MDKSLGAVAYDIVARDKTEAGLGSAGDRAKKIQRTGLMVGAGMTAVGIGAKLMADNINESYLTFDTAMAQVKSLGGLTNDQFEQMRMNAIGISKELPLSASNVADGFYMMRSAGFDANRVIAELPAIADMAVAGNLDMADAVNATTMVLDTYGDAAGSASNITNILMGTVQGFKTTLPELQMQLSKNIGVAAQLGISFEELAAMSGMLKKEFVSSEEAGTAMKTMLMRLADPTVTDKLNDMGVATADANGNFIGMQSILDGLAIELDAAGGNVEQMALLQGIFGTEGVRAAMSLIRQKDELAGYTEQVSAGTAVQEALNAQLESTASQLEIAKNKMEAAKIEMGEAMAPATIFTADAMARLAGIIEGMPEGMQTVIGTGMKMSEVFIGLGPIMMGLSALYPVYASTQFAASVATMGLTAATWKFTVALLANPTTWIVVGIMALIAAIVILEMKFGVITKASDMVSDAFHRLVDWLTDKLAPGIDFVRGMVDRFGDKLLFLLGPVGAVIWGLKKLHSILKDDKEALEDTEEAMDDLKDSVDYLTYSTDNLADAQERIKESAEKVDTLTQAYEDLEAILETVLDLTEKEEDKGRRVEHAQWRLKDAQEAYNEAVEEHGKDSDEAARADLRVRDAVDALDDAEKDLKETIEEIAEEDIKKQNILTENNVKNKDELEGILKTEKEILAVKSAEVKTWEEEEMEWATHGEYGGSFQHGGIVPGPTGAPVPIIAHGGEEFLGVGEKPAVGGDTFYIGPITITNDYDVESLWRKLQELQQSKRMQRGMTVM